MGLLLVLNKHRATPYCSACCIEQLGVSLGSRQPPRGPEARCPLPIVPLMTSPQEPGANSVFTPLAATSAFYFSVAWMQGVVPTETRREAVCHAALGRDWLQEGNIYQKFTVWQGKRMTGGSMSCGPNCNNRIYLRHEGEEQIFLPLQPHIDSTNKHRLVPRSSSKMKSQNLELNSEINYWMGSKGTQGHKGSGDPKASVCY